MAGLQRKIYSHKRSPFSCKSSVGQGKYAGRDRRTNNCTMQPTFSIDELISAGNNKLFRQMSNESHCLHPLLPTQRINKVLICLENRGHNQAYLLPQLNQLCSRTVSLTGVHFLIFSVLCVLYLVCLFLLSTDCNAIVFVNILL